VKPLLTACLVAAIGCSGEPAADDATSYDGCPEPGEFEFSLEWDPEPGSAFPATSTGTVTEVLEDPPGTLTVSVDLLLGDHTPGTYTYRVPLSPGGGIDLFVDDEVTVSTQNLWGCLGCWIYEVNIEREGEVILYVLHCENHLCNESDFEVGPLRFSTVTGRCEPWRDPPDRDTWCNIREHGGLEVGCSGDPDGPAAELFRGEQITVDCGQAYHVSAGYLIRVVGGPSEGTTCADHAEDFRQILVIRDGDGLSG
jgi:hypothetical protein